jgi:hypothetical protein
LACVIKAGKARLFRINPKTISLSAFSSNLDVSRTHNRKGQTWLHRRKNTKGRAAYHLAPNIWHIVATIQIHPTPTLADHNGVLSKCIRKAASKGALRLLVDIIPVKKKGNYRQLPSPVELHGAPRA